MENVILCDKSDLIAMADRVREVTNSTKSFNVPELKEQVINLRGEPILQKKTVNNSKDQQTIKPDEGYDGLSEVTVSFMPSVTQATPTIEVNSSTGVITATSRQLSSGYLTAGTKTTTKTLSTQSAKTITPTKSTQTAVAKGKYTIGAVTVAAIPSDYIKPKTTKEATTYTPGTTNQTIASGTYCSGSQTIKGDENLVAANIAEGVSIFGVTGTHTGGIDTSDATATADDIVTGETAYINGVKVTGTNPYEKAVTTTEVNTQATKLAELKTILQGKAAGGSGGTTVETGTLTGATTYGYGDSITYYYYDFSMFATKVFVLLIETDSIGDTSWCGAIISRETTSDEFTCLDYASSINTYSFVETNVLRSMASSFRYYAI